MLFSKILAAAFAFALASATVQFTNTAAQLTGIAVGKALTINWTGASGAITLKLKSGPSTAQVYVETIASGLTGTSFTWTPEKTLPDATYNLEIDDGSVVNYSVQFEITGGSGNTATFGMTGSATATASSSGSSSAAASTTASTAASSSQASSSGSSTGSSSTKASSSGTSTSSASSTSSTGSVPTSNSAVQNGSPFALVIIGALAIVGLN